MTNSELIGTIFIVGVPLLVAIVTLMKPLFNIAQTIGKILESVNFIKDSYSEVKHDVEHIEGTLSDHETRISVLERT